MHDRFKDYCNNQKGFLNYYNFTESKKMAKSWDSRHVNFKATFQVAK